MRVSVGRRDSPFLCFSALAGAVFFLAAAPSVKAAIVCEKGIGDTEIMCRAKGADGTHQVLSVSSETGTLVNMLVTQWTGQCSKVETLRRTDTLAVPPNTPAKVSVAIPNGAQCANVLFSECKYLEQVNQKVVEKPFFCGELLTVKGAAQ